MKNVLIILFVLVFFLISFLIIGNKQENRNKNENNDLKIEKKGVFLSYIELNKYIKNKSEEDSKNNIIKILDNLKENGFNMLLVHVRPFSDAIYKSSIFAISDTVKNKENNPSYDILEFIISESYNRNIKVHAWINPYRISSNENIESLDLNHISRKYIENGCAKVVEGKGLFYNPACSEVNDLIIDGIKEILNNYKVDGIHFDDYFYPSDEIDLDLYKKYIDNGGNLSLADYRYKNILTLIKDVYWNIKSIDKNVQFGISPEGNIDNDYNKHYLDIKEILSNDGYVDYIMPQIYFGFENSSKPFIKTLKEWDSLIKNKKINLMPALAFYKSGSYDKYAKDGAYEWINNSDIISRQILESRNSSNYGGFSLFRYDYLFSEDKFNDNSKEEFNNLIKIIK